jgi:hypothetical protein
MKSGTRGRSVDGFLRLLNAGCFTTLFRIVLQIGARFYQRIRYSPNYARVSCLGRRATFLIRFVRSWKSPVEHRLNLSSVWRSARPKYGYYTNALWWSGTMLAQSPNLVTQRASRSISVQNSLVVIIVSMNGLIYGRADTRLFVCNLKSYLSANLWNRLHKKPRRGPRIFCSRGTY